MRNPFFLADALRLLRCRAYVFSVLLVGFAPAGFSDSQPSYAALRELLASDPYAEIPVYPVTRDLFGQAGESPDNALREAARRTLSSRADWVEFPQHKLLQANGICFAGVWSVDTDSPYSGLLAPGAVHPAIVRLSVMLGGTRRRDRRALGMAIKLFDQAGAGALADVFVMEAMGGRRRDHVLDVSMDNEPDLGTLPPLRDLATARRLRADLLAADREVSGSAAQLNFRPVSQLTEDGLSPRWLRAKPARNTPRVEADDFRDELRLENYLEATLTFQLEVADAHSSGKRAASWRRIGSLRLDEYFLSAACDTRLHFHHGPATP